MAAAAVDPRACARWAGREQTLPIHGQLWSGLALASHSDASHSPYAARRFLSVYKKQVAEKETAHGRSGSRCSKERGGDGKIESKDQQVVCDLRPRPRDDSCARSLAEQ